MGSCNLIAKQNEQTLQTESKSHQVLYFGTVCVLVICFKFDGRQTSGL